MSKNQEPEFGALALTLLLALLLAFVLSLSFEPADRQVRELESRLKIEMDAAQPHLNSEGSPHRTPIKNSLN